MTLDVLLAVFSTAVWCGVHTAESAAGSEDIGLAMKDAGLMGKQAAIDMGISEQQFSKQRAGREALNYWRLLSLPAAFQIARIKREAARFGLTVLTPHERELMLGAARLGRRRMARMFPHFMSERRVS